MDIKTFRTKQVPFKDIPESTQDGILKLYHMFTSNPTIDNFIFVMTFLGADSDGMSTSNPDGVLQFVKPEDIQSEDIRN